MFWGRRFFPASVGAVFNLTKLLLRFSRAHGVVSQKMMVFFLLVSSQLCFSSFMHYCYNFSMNLHLAGIFAKSFRKSWLSVSLVIWRIFMTTVFGYSIWSWTVRHRQKIYSRCYLINLDVFLSIAVCESWHLFFVHFCKKSFLQGISNVCHVALCNGAGAIWSTY